MANSESRSLVELAREVSLALAKEDRPTLVIGATACAAHGYVRFTNDIDLAVSMLPNELESFSKRLDADSDLFVEYESPTPEDNLGGVVDLYLEDPDVEYDEDDWDNPPKEPPKVEVINFNNPPAGGFPALVRDALARSNSRSEALGASLPTVEDLILFKAYAEGPKSRLDVGELLTRTKPNIVELRKRAEGYNMSEKLEYVLDGLV